MKILYVITKSNWGGAQKYVFDLALAMKNKNNDVSVAFGGNGILSERLKTLNIKTIEIENLGRDVDILKEFSVFKDLYKIFKKEKPDLVHLNSSKIGALGALVGRLAGIKKIVYTAHGFPFREERPFWQILLIKFISWLTIIFSHETICVSQKDFDDVKDWPFVSDKLKVIHNGIEIKDFIKKEEAEDFVRIVSIGELHKNKGFEYAIKAINILKDRIQNFKYTILSFGGEEENNLKSLIRDLHLENFVEIDINKNNHSEMLKDFDIYFMPSVKEGLPYVLLEAGTHFLPVVASDTGGVNEIIENNKNGFLFLSKDINAFALGLEKLIRDKDLRKVFAQENCKVIIEKFDILKMIENTNSLYIKS
ncbi:MAG: glycosyltransferase family 4 protein [Candidatus Paceibacterota bacterium]|jgi:glycosyltransferase involved in cell wall biosynthesis